MIKGTPLHQSLVLANLVPAMVPQSCLPCLRMLALSGQGGVWGQGEGGEGNGGEVGAGVGIVLQEQEKKQELCLARCSGESGTASRRSRPVLGAHYSCIAMVAVTTRPARHHGRQEAAENQGWRGQR